MRLSLSSAAAPDASLPELLQACARRGLSGLELVVGHGHGVDEALSTTDQEGVAGLIRESGVAICGIRIADLANSDLDATARLAADLDTPIVALCDDLSAALVAQAYETFAAAGAQLVLEHPTRPRVAEVLREMITPFGARNVLALGWSIRPGDDDPALVTSMLASAGPFLRYICLHGGGPESAQQTGQGVGTVMGRLALARYAGPLVLTPSTPKYRVVWNAWLGRAGGWGCGSKQSDNSLVTL
ncbi:MAG TPA: hypothetical protein VFI91_07850 [Longimicrobiaceae bacterium]|nr:hypothetical protein [Longimicrobiaceae bacterium]